MRVDPGADQVGKVGGVSGVELFDLFEKERLQGLEKVILSMAETFKTEVTGLRGEIARLAESNRSLQQRLEAPPVLAEVKEPIRPVVSWEPRKRKNPVAGMPLYKKLWVECFEPWKMRHQELL